MLMLARVLAATAVGVATAAIATGPASAQVINRDLYQDTETFSFTACDGVDVQDVDTIHGQFKIRLHGSESKAYVFDNTRSTRSIRTCRPNGPGPPHPTSSIWM